MGNPHHIEIRNIFKEYKPLATVEVDSEGEAGFHGEIHLMFPEESLEAFRFFIRHANFLSPENTIFYHPFRADDARTTTVADWANELRIKRSYFAANPPADSCALNPLEIHPWQRKWWISEKVSFIAIMRPMDFLKLTTPDDASLNKIVAEARPLDAYNQHQYEIREQQAPLLVLDIDEEIITSHEGRHRAAAVLNNGEDEYTVGVKLVTESFVGNREFCVLDSPTRFDAQIFGLMHSRAFTFRFEQFIWIAETNPQIDFQSDPRMENESWDQEQIGEFVIEAGKRPRRARRESATPELDDVIEEFKRDRAEQMLRRLGI